MVLRFLVHGALCIKTDCYGQDTAGSEIAVVKLSEYKGLLGVFEKWTA